MLDFLGNIDPHFSPFSDQITNRWTSALVAALLNQFIIFLHCRCIKAVILHVCVSLCCHGVDNDFLIVLSCEDVSSTFPYWSTIWVYWSSWRTGRCLLRVQLQVTTSPWRNTGNILLTVISPQCVYIIINKYIWCVCVSSWWSSKFFSSNGFLREVNEMNKMNDSLQSELQVSSTLFVFKSWFLPSRHIIHISFFLFPESVQRPGGERTAAGNSAGGRFSSEEKSQWEEEAEWSR